MVTHCIISSHLISISIIFLIPLQQKYLLHVLVVLFAGEVRMPSGKTSRPFIRDNKDGTVTVQYQPTEKGLHEMNIKYDGNHIPG